MQSPILHKALELPIAPHAPVAVRTILLVEDQDFVRNATQEILQGFGYQVLQACDSTEAELLFEEWHDEIDLLITDIVLPGKNGRELAASFRQAQPALKTIFISGYAEQAMNDGSVPKRGTYYLAKPFPVEHLLRKVRGALAEYEGALYRA